MKRLSWNLGFPYCFHHWGFLTVYKSNQNENVFSHIFPKYGQNGCEDVLYCVIINLKVKSTFFTLNDVDSLFLF